jgi:hypothetical protein
MSDRGDRDERFFICSTLVLLASAFAGWWAGGAFGF